MRIKGIYNLIMVVGLLFSSAVHSALVTSAKFTNPTGLVNPTDAIEVWVTLSVAPESDPLVIDPSLGYPFGLPTSFIPSHANGPRGMIPFASYTSARIGAGFLCSGNFVSNCYNGENYTFSFGFGEDAVNAFPAKPLRLAAGESRDFLFGIFTPTTGGADIGDYIFYDVFFLLFVDGLDAAGKPLNVYVELGSTCSNSSSSCAFTRTVSDVPIPAAGVLFLSGLGLVGAARRICRR